LLRRLDDLGDGKLPNDRIIFTKPRTWKEWRDYHHGLDGDLSDDGGWVSKMSLASLSVESYARYAFSDSQRIVYPDIIGLICSYFGDDYVIRGHKITHPYSGYGYYRSTKWTTLMKNVHQWLSNVGDTIYMGVVVGDTPLQRAEFEGRMHNERFLRVFSMTRRQYRGETKMTWGRWTKPFAQKEMATKKRREAFNVRHSKVNYAVPVMSIVRVSTIWDKETRRLLRILDWKSL